MGVDLTIFPECMISGFPAGGLLECPEFLRQCEEAVNNLARQIKGIAVIVGVPLKREGKVSSAAVVLEGGMVRAEHVGAPQEGDAWADGATVSGRMGGVSIVNVQGLRMALGLGGALMERGLDVQDAEEGLRDVEMEVDISAQMYHLGEGTERERAITEAARSMGSSILHVNGVGGQDGVLFGGRSLAVDGSGSVVARGRDLESDSVLVDIRLEVGYSLPGAGMSQVGNSGGAVAGLMREEELHSALVLGLRDYVEKNGFPGVVLGLSGGIDSALVACIAVDALGPSRVHGVMMPSRYSSAETRSDADRLAGILGVECVELPIESIFETFLTTLEVSFQSLEDDLTEENLQARIRGDLLMALSNKFGWLLLATGNKSEAGVGYATLYGDLAGGYAVLSDVLKTDVYRLAEFLNDRAEGEGPIPRSILQRPPSAELRADQTDQDSLPDYDTLDKVIRLLVEERRTVPEIVESGIAERTVREVAAMLAKSEFKRRQAPLGTRVSKAAFGVDRFLPVTNRFVS